MFRKMLFVIGSLAIAACGGGGDEHPLPVGATLELNPTDINWEIAPRGGICNFDPAYYNDHLINLALTNKDGQPLGEVEVSLALDLSAATFTGPALLALYDDRNSNGVPEDDEMLTSSDAAVVKVKTGRYDGARQLWLRVNLSCAYKGTLVAYAGPASASASIEVVEREEE